MTDLADVVIVGGGIMGAALAFELSRRSNRVVLLEHRMLASGATGNGFAWINATSKDTDANYHRLNAEAVAYYDTLLPHGFFRTGIQSGGSLFWVNGEDHVGRERLRRRAMLLQEWAYPVSMVDQSEMHTLEPNVAFGDGAEGLFAPMDRWVTATRLTRFLVGEARGREGDIREDCQVTGFTRMTGAISTVETSTGRVATRTLILAAGLDTPALLSQVMDNRECAHWVPVHPEPGLLVETAPDSAPGSINRVLYPTDSGGLHVRPTASGGLLLGAEDIDANIPATASPGTHHLRTADIPRGVEEALLERIRQFLELPAAVAKNVTSRICLRPMPADGLPIIGPVPGVKGVYVAVCHSGITLGPYLASALALEIITGTSSSLLAPYRVDRFLRT